MDAKVVLIVDSDLGFVFWLGQALQRAKYVAVPARTCPDAISLVSELKIDPDLLIVNVALPDAAGLAESLRRSNPRLKVIALVERGQESGALGGNVALKFKPAAWEDVSPLEWLGLPAALLDDSLIH
jgi:DNA-binding response OmpR family regulator